MVAGRVAIVPKGEWNNSIQYNRLDLVTYKNSAYVAKKAITGVAPDTGSDWMLIVTGVDTKDLMNRLEALEEVSFTPASERTNIASGEAPATLWGKVAKWLADLHKVAFSGKYADLTGRPGNATTTKAGFMTAAQYSKLEGIEDGANKISVLDSTAVTEAGNALDARQANPSVSGSMAAQISALNSRTTVTPVNGVVATKLGRIVIVDISLNKALPAGTWNNICVLPEGYRPITACIAPCITDGGVNYFGEFQIDTSGAISLFSRNTISYITGQIVFVCAD